MAQPHVTCEFGRASGVYAADDRENNFEAEMTWACTSRPTTTSHMCAFPRMRPANDIVAERHHSAAQHSLDNPSAACGCCGPHLGIMHYRSDVRIAHGTGCASHAPCARFTPRSSRWQPFPLARRFLWRVRWWGC